MLQGRHKDVNGNDLVLAGENVTVSGPSGVFNPVSSPTWFVNNLNPGDYVVKAGSITGYTISHAVCVNCSPPAGSYVQGDAVTVNLPANGNYADVYFRYSPVPTATRTPTQIPPTATPTPRPSPTIKPSTTPMVTVYPSTTLPPSPTYTPLPTVTPIPIILILSGDVNRDGCVSWKDLNIVLSNMVKRRVDTINLRADVNEDGKVDWGDVAIVMEQWGKGCRAGTKISK
jgi:hypothetical protein